LTDASTDYAQDNVAGLPGNDSVIQAQIAAAQGYHYHGPEHFVLQHGQWLVDVRQS
jgi:hypothetical protein